MWVFREEIETTGDSFLKFGLAIKISVRRKYPLAGRVQLKKNNLNSRNAFFTSEKQLPGVTGTGIT